MVGKTMTCLLAGFTAICVFLSGPALAWGPEGHQIIAHLAARNLNTHARREIERLLGGDAETMMVLDSNWADEVRADRPETADWHFVNIAIGSDGYRPARDCPGAACVVAQIDRETRLLGDANTPQPQKIEAMRFLIHLVGDLHQPLHTGDRQDAGGTRQPVLFRGKRSNLHHIWDGPVVSVLAGDTASVASELQAHVTPQMKAEFSRGTSADWANESFAVASRIYAELPADDILPDDYPRRHVGVTGMQLIKAGLRLATILNRVYP